MHWINCCLNLSKEENGFFKEWSMTSTFFFTSCLQPLADAWRAFLRSKKKSLLYCWDFCWYSGSLSDRTIFIQCWYLTPSVSEHPSSTTLYFCLTLRNFVISCLSLGLMTIAALNFCLYTDVDPAFSPVQYNQFGCTCHLQKEDSGARSPSPHRSCPLFSVT